MNNFNKRVPSYKIYRTFFRKCILLIKYRTPGFNIEPKNPFLRVQPHHWRLGWMSIHFQDPPKKKEQNSVYKMLSSTLGKRHLIKLLNVVEQGVVLDDTAAASGTGVNIWPFPPPWLLYIYTVACTMQFTQCDRNSGYIPALQFKCPEDRRRL